MWVFSDNSEYECTVSVKSREVAELMKPEVFIYPVLPSAWALTLHRSVYHWSPLMLRASGWLESCASTPLKSRRHLHNRSWRAVVLFLLRDSSTLFKMTKIELKGSVSSMLALCRRVSFIPKWASPDEESHVGWTKATTVQTASVKRLLTAELSWLLTPVRSPFQTFCNTGDKIRLGSTVYF